MSSHALPRCLCTLTTFVLGVLPGFAGKMQTHDIVVEKELLITNLAVVESPMAEYPGPFSFGKLIEELSGDKDPAKFLEDWCALWETEQTVNSFKVAARPGMRKAVIEQWQRADGHDLESEEPWEVNLANAPFRLLGIANRIDLAANVRIARTVDEGVTEIFGRDEDERLSFGGAARYYPQTTTGELRFIFSLIDEAGVPVEGGFTVIFEYPLREVVRSGRAGLQGSRDGLAEFASKWHALGKLEFDDPQYVTQLAALTTPRTESSGESTPQVLQIRTNDGVFGKHREFRECGIESGNRWVQRPVAGTPAPRFSVKSNKASAYLADYIDENADAILDGSFVVPVRFEPSRGRKGSHPFLGGSALIPAGNDEFFWDAKGLRNKKARHVFSLNTCNGCHARETGTQFFHIHPRLKGEESKLSAFLKPPKEGKPLELRDPLTRKRIKLDEMGQRKMTYEIILNPQWSERKVMRLLRNRQRRIH